MHSGLQAQLIEEARKRGFRWHHACSSSYTSFMRMKLIDGGVVLIGVDYIAIL